MKLRARIQYKNKELRTVCDCEYSLKDYTDMLSLDLKRIISDVEDLVYGMNGNLPKDEWRESDLLAFNKIKHKILDKAGEVERLPDNIFDADVEVNSMSAFWDRVLNRKD